MRHTILQIGGCLCILANPIQGAFDEPPIPKIIDEAELNVQLLDLTAAPSSIIGGAVNVITGSYFENERDLFIPGSNPLVVQRSFNSANNERGNLCYGWALNLPSAIIVFSQGHGYARATVKDRGSNLVFDTTSSEKHALKLYHKQLRYGVTNCSSGLLGSRNNIKNKRLDYRHNARHCQLFTECGEVLHYKLMTSKDSDYKTYRVSENRRPNGCTFTYNYENNHLERVVSRGSQGDVISYIKQGTSEEKEGSAYLKLESSTGRSLLYRFQSQKSYDYNEDRYRYRLSSVTRDYSPPVNYEYSYVEESNIERMTKKSLPDNRFLQIQYYEKGKNKIGSESIHISDRHDSRVGRVSALYAPVSSNSSPIKIWSFKYFLHKDHHSTNPIGGHAEVTDALGHRKNYYFSDEQRLTSIKHFLDDGTLYRKEKLVWEESGDEKTFLKQMGLTDDKGRLLLLRDYKYDDRGNVLRERLWGNLSGLKSEDVTWEKYKEAEQYVKTYTYTSQGLMESEEDGSKRTLYSYIKGTDLVKSKLIFNSMGISERIHYFYDANSCLIKEISDDGNTPDTQDLAGVTERRIKRIYPTTSKPIGLPETIEEWFLDLSTGREKLLSRLKNSYSKEGHLIRQNIYDCNGEYCFSKNWSYDSRGNIMEAIDPLGHATKYRYDQNNNRIYQQTPNPDFYTRYSYDCSNRLIREEDVYSDGSILTKSYSYDYMGNRIASIDVNNNTTKYCYDEFGRLIEKIHPCILDSAGRLTYPVDKVVYDCMNNPIEKIDTNGHRTISKYTALGKPYQIEHPDGAFEKFIYHTDGALAKTIDVNGVETIYSYDYQKRKTEERKMSAQGDLLSEHRWIYNTFHLIAEIDMAGYKIHYTYDRAGRQETIRRGISEIRYVYDSRGCIAEMWEMHEPGKYRITSYKYDALNRVIHEEVLDECSTLFTSKSYKYDACGNCTDQILHDTQGDLCTKMSYNAEKMPIEIIQTDGAITTCMYKYRFRENQGLRGTFRKETDPIGNETIKIMDPFGRLAKEEKRNPSGITVQRTFYVHDGEGNLMCRTDDLIIGGKVQKSICIKFFYDSRNREISVIESAGDDLQKVTRKEYHLDGQLAKIFKPNGVVLSHEYDLLGRLTELHSSDGTIHYVYTYDQNNNIVKVDDCILGIATYRIFDEYNLMVSEVLASGLKFSYQYDAMGRIKQFILPDMTTVDYTYDAAKLRKISRLNFDFHYSYYLSGKIAKIDLPHILGTIKYNYDCCLRPINIESKYWSQHIPEGGYDLCGNLLQVTQRDGFEEFTSCYNYDSLNHLVSETGAENHIYLFDSLHNRVSKDDTIYRVNALNQLNQQGTTSYEYDLNGNQSKKSGNGETAKYLYDALDRLTAVIYGNRKIEYIYDSFDRRLKKKYLYASGGELGRYES